MWNLLIAICEFNIQLFLLEVVRSFLAYSRQQRPALQSEGPPGLHQVLAYLQNRLLKSDTTYWLQKHWIKDIKICQ